MTYTYAPQRPAPPRPARPRRRFRPLRWLLAALVAFVVVVAGTLAALVWAWASVPVDTVGEVDFDRRLRVPPLARSHVDAQGRRVFELTAREGRSELLPGTTTRTWGFNGAYLGPTLRADRGEEVLVRVRNALDETTSVHWHGMHLPPGMDGGPHQPVAPGATWAPRWRIDQPAATLWYHPHPHGSTERHVSRGLAGMFIIDDDRASAQRLPHEYGVDDLPVIVQDKEFSSDGQMQETGGFLGGTGQLGDTLLVNGTYGPYAEVTTTRVRLRLLNASTARVYDFGFSDDRDFDLVATDGGLLPSPVRLERVLLSPGERAEVVVEMSPGETVELRSYPPDVGGGVFARFNGGGDSFDVLQLRAADRLAPSPTLPDALAPAPGLGVDGDSEVDRRFELSGRSINGLKMDMSRVDEVVELGSTEVWEVHNRDGIQHNFHVHDVQFQVIGVDGSAPPPELSGWKDTVFLPPGRTMRLAMRFTDYADPDTPYMYHCHLLEHEDRGMMGQFVVVRPGQQPGALHEHGHGPATHGTAAHDMSAHGH